jgi:heparanase
MTLLIMLAVAAAVTGQQIEPATLKAVGRVDPRFQSYNIEMVEVTGGRFWKPYRDGPPKDAADRYAYRRPMALDNKRLNRLATALGPAYIRISGTWASSTFVASKAGEDPPPGFTTMLLPSQWDAVAAFVKNTDGALILSAPTSAGARDAAGVWQAAQLEALLQASQARSIPIAGVTFMNEPNLIGLTGAPANYAMADYVRDFAGFAAVVRRVAPQARILGPDAVGGSGVEALNALGGIRMLPMDELIAAPKPAADIYTYHHYGALSERCATSGPMATTQKDATDPDWLARTEATFNFHAALRDRYASGTAIWVTETAQAACGGSPWAASFADTPRYIDQLGRLARAGVQAVFHNTLAASDYGLLDERDFSPRPNYWAALLWARLMGETVLDLPSPSSTLRTYAHCLKGRPGGVALVAINLSDTPATLSFNGRGQAFVLAKADDDAGVMLNNVKLQLGANDALPRMRGAQANGSAIVAPAGVTFVSLADAGTAACDARSHR